MILSKGSKSGEDVIASSNHDVRKRAAATRGFTLVDIQFLAADVKRTENLIDSFMKHLKDKELNALAFQKAARKIVLYDEIGAKARAGKKRKS